jgi:hypothetical protein
VLVCGSRGWSNAEAIRWRLAGLAAGSVVISGGAAGADTLADQAARELGLASIVYRANWKRDGKRAGVLRNLLMLDSEPALVIAFWDGTSPGTKHTIEEARKRGIELEIWGPGEER